MSLTPQRRPGRPGPVTSPLTLALRSTRWAFGLAMVLSFFSNILRLTIPLFMLQLMDRVVRSHHLDTLVYLTLIAAVALLVGASLNAVRNIIHSRVGAWLDTRLLPVVVQSGLDGPMVPGGSPRGQALQDLMFLRNYFGSQMLTSLLDAPWVPLMLLFLYLIHPMIGSVALLFAVLLLCVALLNHALVARRQREGGMQQMRMMQTIEGAMASRAAVFGMGLLPALMAKVGTLAQESRAQLKVASERTAMLHASSQFLRMLAQISVLATGAYLLLGGDITAGGMIAGAVMLGFALAPVEQSIGSWHMTVNALAAKTRLDEHLATPARVMASPHADAGPPRLDVNKLMFLPPGAGRPVIRQVEFKVASGEMLGIVGPTASGKTVLCQLLVGALVPTSGNAQLDRIEVHRRLGSDVGYIGQQTMLLAGSVAENISRFAPPSPEVRAMVARAAARVDIEQRIHAMPAGFDTPIDDQSPLLSRGERQKIVLARAIYGDPRLLVLDEPTVHLDRSGEAALLEALQQLAAAGSVIVVVTQNAKLLEMCDRLLLLREGMIEMIDTPSAVMTRLRARQNGGGGRRESAAGRMARGMPQLESIPGGRGDENG